MALKPLERESVIRAIEVAGKTAQFTRTWGHHPTHYFEQYSYLEPKIWYTVLNDLKIDVKDV